MTIFSYPDFYNWNRVKIRYCDGSSFTGDVEAVNPVSPVIKALASISGLLFFSLSYVTICSGYKTLLSRSKDFSSSNGGPFT